MKIDSHQHFWKYDPTKHSWINDQMKVIKRDFLPADLLPVLKENGIDGCVAVQADQSEEETKFLLDLAKKNDFIKGVVGWVDLRSDHIDNILETYEGEKLLKGVRHVVQDEPDINFMLGKVFQHGIAALKRLDLTYDILIFPKQLPAAIRLVAEFPNQKFVVDHIAKPAILMGETGDWAMHMLQLAKYPNVFCKVSGMVTEAKWCNWAFDDFIPYLDVVFEGFGTDRIMFGSDWPVCLLSSKYENMKGIIDRYISSFSENEQAKVMGLNAIAFYNL